MLSDQPTWHFLINPAAGRGRAGRQWASLLPRLRAALPGMTVAESSPTTSLFALAKNAVRAGHRYLVGVGGDGTHHQILNGLVDSGKLADITYAPLPLGTGNDWVRTLKTPPDLPGWLQHLKYGRTIEHAVGRLTYHHQDRPRVSYFLNVAGLAYDAEVVRRSETARFKHRWLYPLLTLWYLKDFRPPTVRIQYDGNTFTGAVHTVNLGIGRYNGGGMRLVPQAEPTHNTLALTYARQLSVPKILLSSWRFYTDSIGRVREVTTTTAKEVTINGIEGTLALEADGEWLGVGPVTATLCPQRLSVVVP